MSTLPILKVRTNHSEYLIDQNAGTYSRTTVHEDANHIYNRSAGEWRDYDDIHGPTVGWPLVIIEPGGAWLRSTEVVSIEEVEAAA